MRKLIFLLSLVAFSVSLPQHSSMTWCWKADA